MNALTDAYRLHNSVKIPCVGFGTWQTPNDSEGIEAIKKALEVGYRHIDTAEGYNNEEAVGKAIKESGIPREDIFITSKLTNSEHGYENTVRAFNRTLEALDTDYVDLFLIHWPNPISFRDQWKEANAGSWKAFEEFYNAGKIKAIGVSNFRPHHLEALLESAEILPMVNQIRLCPGNTEDETVDYCREHNILLEAYSPLGTGKVFELDEMKALAKKYNKTIAQICIRWSLQRGYLPLPKSVTPSRIEENADVFDFLLSEDDMTIIANMTGCGESKDPDTTNF